MGEIINTGNARAAVYGLSDGTGPAVYGEHLQAGNGVSGVAHGTGSGLYAQSDKGRGALLMGKKAQLRLQPTSEATHPAGGQKGDFYVDASGRLWYCKGGTDWHQLA